MEEEQANFHNHQASVSLTSIPCADYQFLSFLSHKRLVLLHCKVNLLPQ
uniref:Uncharacterized protein n=1 Tax=Arundo donax TaxID=35708 RepID=A0A0A9FBG3_ARUDO